MTGGISRASLAAAAGALGIPVPSVKTRAQAALRVLAGLARSEPSALLLGSA